jgi:hypothetical protein
MLVGKSVCAMKELVVGRRVRSFVLEFYFLILAG